MTNYRLCSDFTDVRGQQEARLFSEGDILREPQTNEHALRLEICEFL